MFGHRFFGARYYGPRYWGDGGSLPPPVIEEALTDVFAPEGAKERRWRRERDRETELATELRQLYEAATASPESADLAVAAVAAVTTIPTPKTSTWPPQFDWSALAADVSAARSVLNNLRLLAARATALRSDDEEAALVLLLLVP